MGDGLTAWRLSYRADSAALPLADRHYTRQAIGSDQFVPPGRCFCLVRADRRAVWVTSWPRAEYVKHRWAGAWINSLFRSEGAGLASALIREAVALTRAVWTPPPEGLVSFVDPAEVRGVRRRGKMLYGYCYLKAGFEHVGYTKERGLWVWQLRPAQMPPPDFDLTAPLFEMAPAAVDPSASDPGTPSTRANSSSSSSEP